MAQSEMIEARADHLRIITAARHVALVGVSADVRRASFFVLSYLKRTPLTLYLVNPKYRTISGRRCYARLDQLPIVPDLVVIFRRGEAAVREIVDQAIRIGAQAVWLQLGMTSAAAQAQAAAAGIDYVDNRCLKIEYARWNGDLRAIGINRGVISSKRQRAL